MVVLSVGQRPPSGTEKLAEMMEIPLSSLGFCQTEPFSLALTSREGIVLGGSFSGLKDISESVIQASAAALTASRVIHAAGGSLASEPLPTPPVTDILREPPRILITVCTCSGLLSEFLDPQQLARCFKADPLVDQVEFLDQTCTVTGWEALIELFKKHKPNRLLIGACLPYVYARKLRELGRQVGLDPALMDVVDIRTPAFSVLDPQKKPEKKQAEFKQIGEIMQSVLEMGIAKLKRIDPAPTSTVRIHQKALVVGGGIAGMTAALAIADHGFHVDIVEKAEKLGGNLTWLQRTLEGYNTETLLDEVRQKIEKHPMIKAHIHTSVVGSYGQVGLFHTTIEDKEGITSTLEHGVTILATGGAEAATTLYDYGENKAIVTQKELEQKLNDNTLDPGRLETVVMIQCVGSREEPRNYCSRICCSSALKHALHLKEKNPDIAVYILYRDLMAYGFAETYYTQARKADVFFIQYDVDKKPQISTKEEGVQVDLFEPIIRRNIQIDADLVVLATGVVPNLPEDLAEAFGAEVDQDGFFQEAESKWRPVDSLKEGVFACGLAHSPRSIAESIATADAAAQRALRILSRESLPAGKVVAKVRHSLCSLCERCIDACEYEARTLDLDLEKVLVNPVMCQGCGSCAAICPNGASVVEGFHKQQMLDIIDAALL